MLGGFGIISAIAAWRLWDDERGLAWLAIATIAVQLVLWRPIVATRDEPMNPTLRVIVPLRALAFLVGLGLLVYSFL